MAHDLQTVERETLYRTDLYAWAYAQLDALKHLRAQGVGANAIDWDNLLDEVEGVAGSVLRGCRSYVKRIVEHLIKLEFVDSARDHGGWRREIRAFRQELRDDLSATLRNELQPLVRAIYDEQLRNLAQDELPLDAVWARRARPDGYTWAEITEADWFPEPRVEAEPA